MYRSLLPLATRSSGFDFERSIVYRSPLETFSKAAIFRSCSVWISWSIFVQYSWSCIGVWLTSIPVTTSPRGVSGGVVCVAVPPHDVASAIGVTIVTFVQEFFVIGKEIMQVLRARHTQFLVHRPIGNAMKHAFVHFCGLLTCGHAVVDGVTFWPS